MRFCCASLMVSVSSVLRTYTRYSRVSPDILTITNKAKKRQRSFLCWKIEFYAKCLRLPPTDFSHTRFSFAHWLRGKIPKHHRFIRLIFRSVSLTNTITHRRYRIIHIYTQKKWRFCNISVWSNRVSLYYSP